MHLNRITSAKATKLLFFFYFIVRFLMKSDDDMFINIPNIKHLLLGGSVPAYAVTQHLFEREPNGTYRNESPLNSTLKFVMGLSHIMPSVVRDESNKW